MKKSSFTVVVDAMNTSQAVIDVLLASLNAVKVRQGSMQKGGCVCVGVNNPGWNSRAACIFTGLFLIAIWKLTDKLKVSASF